VTHPESPSSPRTPPLRDRTAACEQCGRPARVRILEGYQRGQPVYRVRCVDCADRLLAAPRGSRWRAGRATTLLLAVGGLALAAWAALFDRLEVGAGLGWLRLAGLVGGALCVICGAVLNVPVLGLAGFATFTLTALLVVFALHGEPGFGWKQSAAVLGGLGVALLALWRRRRWPAVRS
jgi:MYXO-CTERM domain-containing protein